MSFFEEVEQRRLSATSKQKAEWRRQAELIVKILGEEMNEKQIRQCYRIVRVHGVAQVKAWLVQAKEIYTGDGMLILNGSRKRTFGGIFYRLVHLRDVELELPWAVRKVKSGKTATCQNGQGVIG